jgi:hypothetical protein
VNTSLLNEFAKERGFLRVSVHFKAKSQPIYGSSDSYNFVRLSRYLNLLNIVTGSS